MKFVHAVTILDKETNISEIARVFTKWADAELFVATCEKEEPNDKFEYFIDEVELDGDPQGNYVTIRMPNVIDLEALGMSASDDSWY